MTSPVIPGRISFIALPDCDLKVLTVAALDALKDAQAVVVDPALVEVVAAVATVTEVLSDQTADLVKAAISAAKEGKEVVRVFFGDGILRGSLIEELTLVNKANLDFEVFPTIPVDFAVGFYAGAMFEPTRTDSIHLLDAKDSYDLGSYVGAKTTLILRGTTNEIGRFATDLAAAGRVETTAMVLVQNAMTLDQRSYRMTLGDAAEYIKAHKLQGPAHAVISESAGHVERNSWFETRSLFGWKVLIPKTKEFSVDVAALLAKAGATCTEVPTLSVEPPRAPQQMEKAVHGLVSGRYQWIAFTSPHAVKAIKVRLDEYGLDARAFSGIRIAAVGADTIEILKVIGINPDLISPDDTNAGLANLWPVFDQFQDPMNRVLIPRADVATESLSATLISLGWEVEEITAFRTVRAAPPPPAIRDAIKSGGFDAVLFSSASTVRNLVGIAGKPHPTTVIACIGEQTAAAARDMGLVVEVLPEETTISATIESLIAHGEKLRLTAIENGDVVWRPSVKRLTRKRS
jgi:uroporphyrinogen III methyltransferase / synthase